MALRRNLLAQSVINGLIVAFPVHSIPNPRCVVQACPPAEVAPEPDPEPEPRVFSAFFTGGANVGEQQVIVPYTTSLETGIGAPLAGTYDLQAAGLSAPIFSSPPAYGPGLMLIPGATLDGMSIYALSVTPTGVTRITGEMAFTPPGASTFGTPAVAYLDTNRAFAFVSTASPGNEFEVAVGEVNAGTFARIGSALTGTDATINQLAKAAVVIDGHLCLAVGDPSLLDSDRYRLRSYSFDGTAITAEDVEDISAQKYQNSGILAGNDYIAMFRLGGPGVTVDVYGYTALAGFALRFSVDLTTVVAGFSSVESWLIDSANGNLWVALSDGASNFRQAVFSVGASALTEQAVITVPEHVAYGLAVYDDVLAHNDATYNDTQLSVRTGATLDTLTGSVTYDSAFFIPVLEP